MADLPDFPITVLVATTKSGGIAYQGELPWPIDKDVCPFGGIKLPERSAVIMGRKTWSSIPSAYRPLRDHLNVALTSGDPTDFPEGVVVAASFAAALESLQGRVQGAFAIGGSSVFDQAMRLPQCFELQVTTVSEEFKADHFLQPPSGFWTLASPRSPGGAGIPSTILLEGDSEAPRSLHSTIGGCKALA